MTRAGDSCPAPAPDPAAAWEQTDLLALVSGAAVAPPAAEPMVPPSAPEEIQAQSLPAPLAATALAALPDSAPGPTPSAPDPVHLPPFLAASASPKLPRLLLILDTETTGLDPAREHCIEVGAVLFAVADRAVLSQVSFLLPCRSNGAEAINGIPARVSELPQPWQAALQCFEAMVAAADVVVAHNAGFDRQWFGSGPLPPIDRPWLCTMEDLRWPAGRNLRPRPSVRDLALAYGVPVWAAHRALTDCIYLAQVFERCSDLEELLVAGLEPRRLYRARVSYGERHRAREAGFRWNDPVDGAWCRRLSEREAALLSFPVVAVEDDGVDHALSA